MIDVILRWCTATASMTVMTRPSLYMSWWHWSWRDCMDTLESRRAQLTERVSGTSGSVCCAKHPVCTICCRTNTTRQWQTVCAMPRLLNFSLSELINLAILSPSPYCLRYYHSPRPSITCILIDCIAPISRSLHWLLYTRQHNYRKEDRAMRPIYGCPEKFSESSLRTRILFQKFVTDFGSDRY